MKPISYTPTDGLTYDPEDLKYWEDDALEKEVQRVFEICNGCRMCFKFCDSFPTLFSLLDDERDVRTLKTAETRKVMDACFQCKLCEVQCPYTPRDKHEYQVDFPKLVHRYQAQRARFEGVKLRDELLSEPDLLGSFARASFGVANTMNKVTPHRVLMEKTLGIHRDKLLPDFAAQTFERWAEGQGRVAEEPGAEAVVFQTCFVQNNSPEIGRDTLDVLDHNGVKAACLKGLKCCGMPAWEHGDLDRVRELARANLDLLSPHVAAGSKVLAINPTCSMMMRREWPELVPKEDRPRASALAAAVMDPGEFLWSIRREPRFNRKFKSTPGNTIAYHAPCHLRAQHVGFKGRDLIRMIPGVETAKSVLECCGHDGTYAMKVEGYEVSQRVGQRAFGEMKDSPAEVWVTECPLAAVQFEQHAGKKPLHPMTVLARAYREDGFPERVEAPDNKERAP